jgi:Helix-turn-helix domain
VNNRKNPAPLGPLDPAQRYSIPEAARYLRVSRSFLWARVKDGELVTIRHRKRKFIPGTEIARLSEAPKAT